MSSNDKFVENLAISILDPAWVRGMFAILRDYYKEKNYDLLPVHNLLEANLLNANAQLEASSRLFKEEE